MKTQQLIEATIKGERSTDEPEIRKAILDTLAGLDRGELRCAENVNGAWTVNVWVKQAILLYFRIQNIDQISMGDINYFDKIPPKKWAGTEGVRSVPLSFVRYGSHVAKGVILMPSFVNIGAYVGSGSMVDTWATVGSCAQIGTGVHLSGGVGIGGVLEPAQASPVIIEDHAFIGSRAIVVEGVRVGARAVLGAGVVLTASTKILDMTGSQIVTHKGFVPPGSVVIPGSTEKKFAAGSAHVPCALIIGQRSSSTDEKTSLNQVLRDFEIPV